MTRQARVINDTNGIPGEAETREDGINALAHEVARKMLEIETDEMTDSHSLSPALSRVYTELGIEDTGDAANIVVSFIAEGSKLPEAMIWRGQPEDYDLQQLSRIYGSGAYRVKIYIFNPNSEKGNKALRANRVIMVKLPPQEDAAIKRQSEMPTGANIAEQISAAVNMALSRIQPQSAQSPADMLKMSIEMAKLMIPPPPPPPPNPLEMVRAIVEMQRATNDDREPIDRGANASTNDIIIAMINKFGPLAAGLLGQNLALPNDQSQSTPAQPEQAPMLANHGEPPQSTQPTEQQVTDMNAAAIAKLQTGIRFLIGCAKSGGHAETYADVVLDNVPGESVEELLKLPDPVSFLALQVPEVSEHREWFDKLFKELKDIVENPE